MTFRRRFAHHLLRLSLRLITPSPTIEGMLAMKLWDAIVDLRKQVADINSKLADHGQVIATTVDADQLKALSDAVDALPTKDMVADAIGAAMQEVVGDEPEDVEAPANAVVAAASASAAVDAASTDDAASPSPAAGTAPQDVVAATSDAGASSARFDTGS